MYGREDTISCVFSLRSPSLSNEPQGDDLIFCSLHLQGPPRKKQDWGELRRLVADGDRLTVKITDVNM